MMHTTAQHKLTTQATTCSLKVERKVSEYTSKIKVANFDVKEILENNTLEPFHYHSVIH